MSLDVSDFPLNLDPEAIPQIPIPEPENICAGGTITWRRQFDTYLPGGGFSLSYVSWADFELFGKRLDDAKRTEYSLSLARNFHPDAASCGEKSRTVACSGSYLAFRGLSSNRLASRKVGWSESVKRIAPTNHYIQ